jgi:hypothetical protein
MIEELAEIYRAYLDVSVGKDGMRWAIRKQRGMA